MSRSVPSLSSSLVKKIDNKDHKVPLILTPLLRAANTVTPIFAKKVTQHKTWLEIKKKNRNKKLKAPFGN